MPQDYCKPPLRSIGQEAQFGEREIGTGVLESFLLNIFTGNPPEKAGG